MASGAILGPLALLAALAVAAPAAATPARAAACGSAKHYMPSATPPLSPPPLAIGDSIMMGAVEPLRRRGFELDVRGCRQMSEGLRVLGARARAGSLPKQVAIGLGTNWTVTLGQIRRALRTVGRERVLGLVTPREVGGAASTDQEAIRAAGLALARARPGHRLGRSQHGPPRLVLERRPSPHRARRSGARAPDEPRRSARRLRRRGRLPHRSRLPSRPPAVASPAPPSSP